MADAVMDLDLPPLCDMTGVSDTGMSDFECQRRMDEFLAEDARYHALQAFVDSNAATPGDPASFGGDFDFSLDFSRLPPTSSVMMCPSGTGLLCVVCFV